MKDNASSSMRNLGEDKAASSSKGKEDLLRSERNRREKMSEFYTMLQSMVPNLFPRATKVKIMDETIDYIKTLEKTIVALDSQKMETKFQTQRSSSISVTVSGKTAFFGLRMVSHPGLVTRVMEVFEKHKAEVLAATVAGGEDGCINVTVTALLAEEEGAGAGAAERIKADLIAI